MARFKNERMVWMIVMIEGRGNMAEKTVSPKESSAILVEIDTRITMRDKSTGIRFQRCMMCMRRMLFSDHQWKRAAPWTSSISHSNGCPKNHLAKQVMHIRMLLLIPLDKAPWVRHRVLVRDSRRQWAPLLEGMVVVAVTVKRTRSHHSISIKSILNLKTPRCSVKPSLRNSAKCNGRILFKSHLLSKFQSFCKIRISMK